MPGSFSKFPHGARLCVELYQNNAGNSISHVGSILPCPLPPKRAKGRGAAPLCGVVPPVSEASLGKEREITKPPPTQSSIDDSLFKRLERYELQRIAADLLEPFKRIDRAGASRSPTVCKCLRAPRKPAVEIWQSRQHEKFFYGGLVTCGSVWDCLPCATKISERRRVEVKQAIDAWEAQGGSVHMLTLTFPHYENQHTGPLLEKFGAARVTMRNRKTWRSTSRALALVGSINRVEVTYGANGAHIHCHELLFSKHKFLTIAPGCFYPMWAGACVSSGLDAPSEAHGVKISTPAHMAEYVSKIGKEASKWTIELEMTKGHIKRGKVDGMTPFDLLRAYRDTGDCDHADTFVEYSKAFKGKRQLTWSRGLRDLLQLEEEQTDEEVAKAMEDDAEIFALVGREDWSLVNKFGLRGQMIEVCSNGIEALKNFIESIREKGKNNDCITN
jgi:hypothetical protein